MFGLRRSTTTEDDLTFDDGAGESWDFEGSASAAPSVLGLIAGTMVATASGWRPIEAITRDELVLTFDRGMQPVKSVTRSLFWVEPDDCPGSQWPLLVPAGALGNAEPMTILPDQQVMMESDMAEILFGDPFPLILAVDLEGFRGIQRIRPQGPASVTQLHFDQDDVVFANNGALMFCARNMFDLDGMLSEAESGTFRGLEPEEAQYLIRCILDEEAAAAEEAAAEEDEMFTRRYAAA